MLPLLHILFLFLSADVIVSAVFLWYAAFKRSDSVRSKRKVSSISDRSDFSDVHLEHDISGEESPGILSDDQHPDSPSDVAEIEECISVRGMPWLRVCTYNSIRRMYSII